MSNSLCPLPFMHLKVVFGSRMVTVLYRNKENGEKGDVLCFIYLSSKFHMQP